MGFEDLECIKIDSAESALDDRKAAYLRSRGWEYTSQTVDSVWRWFKTIKGRHYGCGIHDAFHIQDFIDRREYAAAHPDEFND
jgi:hypothetical protein